MHKDPQTESEWLDVAAHCLAAYLVAPKYSPMRILFSLGEKHARKKAAQSTE